MRLLFGGLILAVAAVLVLTGDASADSSRASHEAAAAAAADAGMRSDAGARAAQQAPQNPGGVSYINQYGVPVFTGQQGGDKSTLSGAGPKVGTGPDVSTGPSVGTGQDVSTGPAVGTGPDVSSGPAFDAGQ
jgi:hypothetical protein